MAENKPSKWEVDDNTPFTLALQSCTKITNNADKLMSEGEVPTWEKVKGILESELDEYDIPDEDRQAIINGMHNGYLQIYKANDWQE